MKADTSLVKRAKISCAKKMDVYEIETEYFFFEKALVFITNF